MFVERRHFGRNLTNINNAANGQGHKVVAAKATAKMAAPTQFAVFSDNATQTEQSWQTEMLPMPAPIHHAECEPMCIEEESLEIENIDELDQCDPQFVSDYVTDIIAFLKQKEVQCKLPANHLAHQRDIRTKDRDVLVMWMAKIYRDLRLLSETLFLAVDIVDRILASGIVMKKKLHLLAIGALLIASKFEETYAPTLEDFHVCSKNSFLDEDIIRMEKVLLNRIGFNLCVPSALQFLRRYSKAARSDSATHTLSKYLTELSLTSHSMVGFLPSEIAASAVLLARNMRGAPKKHLWNATLTYYSGFEQYEIMTCARALNKVLYNEQMRQHKCSISAKYASSSLLAVSRVPYRDL